MVVGLPRAVVNDMNAHASRSGARGTVAGDRGGWCKCPARVAGSVGQWGVACKRVAGCMQLSVGKCVFD